MASGAPLVTTNVGQAIDLVKHGHNAWISENNTIEELVGYSLYVLEENNDLDEGTVVQEIQT